MYYRYMYICGWAHGYVDTCICVHAYIYQYFGYGLVVSRSNHEGYRPGCLWYCAVSFGRGLNSFPIIVSKKCCLQRFGGSTGKSCSYLIMDVCAVSGRTKRGYCLGIGTRVCWVRVKRFALSGLIYICKKMFAKVGGSTGKSCSCRMVDTCAVVWYLAGLNGFTV